MRSSNGDQSVRIAVTDHALERWRERAPDACDATKDDVIEAFRCARKVPKDEPVPFVRQDGAALFAFGGGYFVTDRNRAKDELVILTFKRSWVLDLHEQSKKAIEESRKAAGLAPVIPVDHKIDERVLNDPLPKFSATQSEHNWLGRQRDLINNAMGKLRRDDPLRAVLVQALDRIGRRKEEMQKEKQAYLSDKNRQNLQKTLAKRQASP